MNCMCNLSFVFHIRFKKTKLKQNPHSEYEHILHLESLKTYRINTYSNFFFKFINNEFDDAFLLNQINFKTNTYNLQNNDLFYIPHFS